MKITNIALAVIGAATRAHAKLGFLRDPRSVEEKEGARRRTMGVQVSSTYLDQCSVPGETCAQEDTCGFLVNGKMDGDLNSLIVSTETATDELLVGNFKIGDNPDYMQACHEISTMYEKCKGCQGYELEAVDEKALLTGNKHGMVHIPGCLNMSQGECEQYAKKILNDHPEWFPENLPTFITDLRQLESQHEQWYWMLALPIDNPAETYMFGNSEEAMDQEIYGLGGDCLVYYPYLWCLSVSTGNVQCTQLPPFDCSGTDKSCLSAGECCAKINGNAGFEEGADVDALYEWPDINGNKLQCYAWPLNAPEYTRTPCEGICCGSNPPPECPPRRDGPAGPPELRLIVHINHRRVVLPAVITARRDFVVQSDRGIAATFDEKNIKKWEINGDNLDAFMKDKGKGVPVAEGTTELAQMEIEHVHASDEVWDQAAATPITAGSGSFAGTGDATAGPGDEDSILS